MRAGLKSPDTPDSATGELASYQPPDSEHFALLVGATIGPVDGDGGDLFHFSVCSRSWLAEGHAEKGFEFLRSILVLDRWDAALVERAIGDLCRHTSGADWNEIGVRPSRYGAWEFEDYCE